MRDKVFNVDCLQGMKQLKDNSVDLLVTDPPYGYSFMGKYWDQAVPKVEIWKECLRVLKPGSFGFVMCAPRQDVLSRMIVNLQDAGFRTDFTSIYYTYASGFPKALNIEKVICKRYEKSKSQVSEMWKAIIRETKYEKESDNWKLMQTLLENLEQTEQHKIYAHSSSQSESVQIPGRQRQSWLERWDNLQEKKGPLQFQRCKICEMPTTIFINGSEGWMGCIAQIINGSTYWESIDEQGGCTSHQSQTRGQQDTKFDAICEQCRTQKVRDLSGSFGGAQVKPAVEIIIVVMKPLSENTFVNQALKNGKGVTWLDKCRIPYDSKDKDFMRNRIEKYGTDEYSKVSETKFGQIKSNVICGNLDGRFPANLLVSDDVLNDGTITKTSNDPNRFKGLIMLPPDKGWNQNEIVCNTDAVSGDSGSFSRYFSLDSWWQERIKKLPRDVRKVFPFLLVPKASKSEKNKGCEKLEEKQMPYGSGGQAMPSGNDNPIKTKNRNIHPTVKPLQLMSYLITLGSQQGDLVLDPFVGSGTTAIASRILSRSFVAYELNKEYYEIAQARLKPFMEQQKLNTFK